MRINEGLPPLLARCNKLAKGFVLWLLERLLGEGRERNDLFLIEDFCVFYFERDFSHGYTVLTSGIRKSSVPISRVLAVSDSVPPVGT